MSIIREASGTSSNEGGLYVGRSNIVGTPTFVNSSNFPTLYGRPEFGGTASHPFIQVGSSPLDNRAQAMDLLTKRPLSDIERQVMLRVVRQRNHNLPMLPSSSMDSVALSESSHSMPHSVLSYPYHRQHLSFSPSHSQGSVYSPTSQLSVSDSNSDEFPSLPILQSASALDKPVSHENIIAQSHQFILPKLKSYDVPKGALGGSAKMVEDQEGIRHKLQELERELLSDNDDSVIASAISSEQSNHLDQEWADTIQNLLSEDSILLPPTISDESQANPCVNKDSPTSQTSRPQQDNHKQSFPLQTEEKVLPMQPRIDPVSSCKKLLVECATAISEGKVEQSLVIIRQLMKMVSVYGDPMQRLTAYMVEGLVTRLGPLAQGLCNALKWQETPNRDHLSAAQLLYEVCPYVKFGYLAANSIILEAFKTEDKIHIIDFEIRQGNQYVTLIHNLAARSGGPPAVRITAVDDFESSSHVVGGLHLVREKLAKLANALGVPLQFHTISEKISDVQPRMLGCRSGEALAVNFAFQLHHVPDESVSTKNPRDQLLRMVKGLNPKVVTIVEKEMNTNTAPFLSRFMETLAYYSAMFESLDTSLPRESRDRINIEKQCLARDIVNIVACEGADRTERFEVAGKWRARMSMAGFSVYPLSSNVDKSIRSPYESTGTSYMLKEEKGALHFGWQDKALVVTSAWH